MILNQEAESILRTHEDYERRRLQQRLDEVKTERDRYEAYAYRLEKRLEEVQRKTLATPVTSCEFMGSLQPDAALNDENRRLRTILSATAGMLGAKTDHLSVAEFIKEQLDAAKGGVS